MKVSELIEKLKEFDPELTVTFSDTEDGTQVVYDLGIHEDTWVGWNKATVLSLWGEYAEKEHIAEKYFTVVERPVYEPNPIMDNLKIIYDSAVPKDTVFFLSISKLPKPTGEYIEFPIHNKRDDD